MYSLLSDGDYSLLFFASDAYMYMNAKAKAVTDSNIIADLTKEKSAGIVIL